MQILNSELMLKTTLLTEFAYIFKKLKSELRRGVRNRINVKPRLIVKRIYFIRKVPFIRRFKSSIKALKSV